MPNPDDYPYLLRLYKSFGLSDPIGGIRIVFTGEEQNEVGQKKEEETGEKARILLHKLAGYRKEYKKLTEKKEPVEHPLGVLSTLMIRALDAFDITTIEEIIRVIDRNAENFIRQYRKEPNVEPWSPNDKLTLNYVDDLLAHIRIYYHHCERNRYDYARLPILQMTKHLGSLLTGCNLEDELNRILDFWKEVADQSIGTAPQVFYVVAHYYDDVFRELVDQPEDDTKNILD